MTLAAVLDSVLHRLAQLGYYVEPERKALDARAQRKIVRAHDAMITRHTPKWRKRASEAFRLDYRNASAIVSGAKKKALQRKASIAWREVLDDLYAYFDGQSEEQWRAMFIPLVRGVVVETGKRWSTALGMQFDVQNLEARNWFNQYVLTFAQEVSDTTKGNIAQIMARAQAEGASIPQVQAQLDALFERYISGELPTDDDFDWFTDRTPAYRTEMIARTEIQRSSNAGSSEIFKAFGAPRKEWLTAIDGRERPEHAAANGQVVSIDAPFIVGGEQLMYPGDPAGSAGTTINCRCAEAPVFD